VNAIEEGEKVATSAISTFKDRPVVLALVIMNAALIGFIYYQGISQTELRRDNAKLFVTHMETTQQLLSKCVVPDIELRKEP
jgi:hypothetical protein